MTLVVTQFIRVDQQIWYTDGRLVFQAKTGIWLSWQYRWYLDLWLSLLFILVDVTWNWLAYCGTIFLRWLILWWLWILLCKAFIYAPLKQTYAILLGWHHFSLSPPICIFHIDIYLDLNFDLWDWRHLIFPLSLWWQTPCFVSRLWVVQQNLLNPWSFWVRRTRWCWFLRLGELGFEDLTSLVGCPQCLVLTVDIPPSCSKSCQLKLEAFCLPSLHALYIIFYILKKCNPIK